MTGEQMIGLALLLLVITTSIFITWDIAHLRLPSLGYVTPRQRFKVQRNTGVDWDTSSCKPARYAGRRS